MCIGEGHHTQHCTCVSTGEPGNEVHVTSNIVQTWIAKIKQVLFFSLYDYIYVLVYMHTSAAYPYVSFGSDGISRVKRHHLRCTVC